MLVCQCINTCRPLDEEYNVTQIAVKEIKDSEGNEL